jgi:hypothetical protein
MSQQAEWRSHHEGIDIAGKLLKHNSRPSAVTANKGKDITGKLRRSCKRARLRDGGTAMKQLIKDWTASQQWSRRPRASYSVVRKGASTGRQHSHEKMTSLRVFFDQQATALRRQPLWNG